MLRHLQPDLIVPRWDNSRMWKPKRRRIWTPRDDRYWAGDIKNKYASSPTTLTVTNLHSLASNSTFTTGWTSAWVDNSSNLYLNSWIYGTIYSGTNPTAGSIRLYAYSYDGTNTPDLFSTGTEGTEGSGAVVTDTEQLDASFVLLWSSAIDTTTNDPYVIPPRSIRQAFGCMPRGFAFYIAHDTVAALKASGNVLYVDHELAQYT